jgi:hypothetical protein
MISFTKLGSLGQLGNQLFQYAYLRASARRLGTTFYCPDWEGNRIFNLADESEREEGPVGITRAFDSHPVVGFNPLALEIADGTEIMGYFQSEKYFPDKQLVRQWFTFRDEIKATVARHYSDEYLRSTVSVSVRLGEDYNNTRQYFPLFPLPYYEKSLRRLNAKSVLVFSDRPPEAEAFFRTLRDFDVRIVTELDAPQSLCLLSQCAGNVINNSTFAWWGAWLNQTPNHKVVAAAEWTRPGVPDPIEGIVPDDWFRVRGTVPIWDHFQIWRLRHPIETMSRVYSRMFPKKIG